MMQNICLVNFINDKYLSNVSNELSKSSEIINFSFLKNKFSENHNNFDLAKLSNRSLFYKIKIQNKYNLSIDEVQFLQKKFYLYSQCCDRTFIYKLSIRSHKKFYIDVCTFLILYLKKNKISKIVFSDSPHLPAEVMIFIVAKLLELDVIILRHTKIKNRIVVTKDIEFSKKFELINDKIDEDVANTIYKEITSVEDIYETASKKINSVKITSSRNFFSSLKSKIFFLRNFKNLISGYNENTYYDLKWYQVIFFLIKRERQRFSLIKWMNKNCDKIDLKEKYLYFAMHFQPERTTDPDAGIYTDQIYAIKYLASRLPDGWFIYIKEHPRQLNDVYPDIRKINFRNKSDYDEIKKINKVKFVHPTFSDEELIKNSMITCSLQGSTVWKGLLKGKPGITFNQTWHSFCKSSPVAKLEDLNNQLIQLSLKDKSTVEEDLYKFCNTFTMYSLNALNMGNYIYDYQSDKRLITNLSDFILK